MKNTCSSLTWEAPYGPLVLQDHPLAFCVTLGWAPNLSGLGLGHGSQRPCSPATRKAVDAGAIWVDRFAALDLGCRTPGVQGEDSPQSVYRETQPWRWRTQSWASPCPPQTL